MGIPEEKAVASIRISFGKFMTRKQINDVLKIIKNLIDKKRLISPKYE
jgi:cysteine sulfinate desulfinase/cysteine desulfurase-like protein